MMIVRRLAFYMHDLSGGGVERMRLALIAELRSRGHYVTLVVSKLDGPLVALLPADLPVVELGRGGMLGAIRPLAKFLRQDRPDVLVASLDHNNVSAIVARLFAFVQTRIVICQHNALSAEQLIGWRYRVIPWLYWLLQFGAHGIVAVSHGVANDLATTARIARSRVTPIYNPVIGPDFAERSKGPAPHPWLADKSCPVFIFVGRLSHQKDPETLLQAMALLLQQHPARVILLGQGPLLARLQASAARLGIVEHVAFPGFRPNPLPWLKHADALVSVSRYEGLGNVLIEALACGTPVISTDCPHGPAEILQAGTFGRLVPVEDAEALSRAMLAHLDEPIYEQLTERASAFTAASCANAHQALFDQVLAVRGHVNTLGMRLSGLRADQVVHLITTESVSDSVRLVVTPNLDHVRLLRQPEFAAAYRSARLVCPDGFPVLLYARLRGLRLSARVTGCDLFHRLAHHPRLADQIVFFVLESRRTQEAVSAWASSLGIQARVRTTVAPDNLVSSPLVQAAIVAEVHEVRPSILVMTLGAPFSEIFVNRHRSALPPCWALCVGQAVRVELGLMSRAPETWRRLGLEWLWRVRQEPGRLAGRYIKDAAWFPVALIRDILEHPAITGRVESTDAVSH